MTGIYIAAILTLLVAFGSIYWGISHYDGSSFGPSLLTTGIGIATSASIAFFIVLLTLRIDRRQTRKKLSGVRINVLSSGGQEFCRKLLDFLAVLGIGGSVYDSASCQGWDSGNTENWPSKTTWTKVKKAIEKQKISTTFDGNKLVVSFTWLAETLKTIAFLPPEINFFSGHDEVNTKAVLMSLYKFEKWKEELNLLNLGSQPHENHLREVPTDVVKHLRIAALDACSLMLDLIRISEEIEIKDRISIGKVK